MAKNAEALMLYSGSVMRASEMGGWVRFWSSTKAVFELLQDMQIARQACDCRGMWAEHLGFS